MGCTDACKWYFDSSTNGTQYQRVSFELVGCEACVFTVLPLLSYKKTD